MSLVGKHIDAHCTKCKLLLAHVVMYEVDRRVKKVKCKTCGSEHMYRVAALQKKKNDPASAGPGQGKRGKTPSKSQKPVNDDPIHWQRMHSEMNPETPVRPYRIQDTYKSGDVIRHHLFGLGFVRRGSDASMEVLFKDAVKQMAMNIK